MMILAFDTSSSYLSVAFARDGEILSSYHRWAHMKQSSRLIPVIDLVLRKAGATVRDIEALAVSIGPGSFTGLRIGVTTAKSFAISLGVPVVAVPTLDVIAWNAVRSSGVICPVLDAKKEKVYACFYTSDGKNLKRTSKYLLTPPASLVERANREARSKCLFFMGDGAERYKDILALAGPKAEIRTGTGWYPRATVVASLAALKFKRREFSDPYDLTPLYLYSKECDISPNFAGKAGKFRVKGR